MTRQEHVPCPHCGQAVDMSFSNSYRPFCSRRCKLIDLGDWLSESHHISDPDGTADPMAEPRAGYGDGYH